MEKTYKITKPIRLIELFGGVGSQAMALRNIGANFEHYRLVEFDKYPIASYNAIHGTDFKPTDITKINASDLGIVDTNKYEYIMTYSFPCQDLSLAGKQNGMTKGSGTRSGLLWEVERLLNECEELPQVLLMENVPPVIGKKNIKDFEKWQLFLKSKGYKNFVQLLNSKDFGIPQNRKRCFMISLLADCTYEFPKPFELKLRLKDMLEDEVDEKYFLSDAMIEYITANNKKWTGNNNKSIINKSCASTINTGEGSKRCDASNYICDDLPDNFDLKCVGSLKGAGLPWDKMYDQCCKVYNPDGISPTLDTMQGGNRQPKIVVAAAIRGRGKDNKQQLEISNNEYAHAITTVQKDSLIVETSLLTETQEKMITTDKETPTTNTCNNDNNPKIIIVGKTRSGGERSAILDTDGISSCLTATDYKQPKQILVKVPLKRGYSVDVKAEKDDTTEIDVIGNYSKSNYQATAIVGKNGVAPTVRENHGQVTGVIVKDKVGNKIPLYKNTKQLRETIEKNEFEKGKPLNLDLYNRATYNNSQTLSDPTHNSQRLFDGLRIRKLTPKECWRLMGFTDTDFEKANKVNSNTQLYKQAGNSIVVNVLEAILKKLL